MTDRTKADFNKDAETAFKRAKLALIGLGGNRVVTPGAAFFGHLAFRLRDVQTHGIAMKVPGGTKIQMLPTAATDGTRLFYNPDFVLKITRDQLIGVICHEIMHCVALHHLRLRYVGDRNNDRRQVACDLAINNHVLDAGFALPMRETICVAGEHKFARMPAYKSAEEYFTLLTDKVMDELTKQGQGAGGKGDIGSIFIPDQLADQGEGEGEGEGRDDFQGSEQDWKMATAEAAQVARQRGEIPGGLGAMIDELLQTPKLDWRTILAQFLTTYCREDYSWIRPSRRSHLGAVLPQLHSERPGHVVVALDTSGSVSDRELAEFCSELAGIMQCLPSRVSVIWCDCRIQRVDEWRPSDGPFKAKPVGRGGTSHRPVFDWVDKLEEPPICLVALTDLETDFPATPPSYPVLWVTVGRETAPFGEVVKL